VLIILIVIGVSAFALWPFFTPDLSKAGITFASDESGDLYLSERHANHSFLYKLDDRGRVEHMLRSTDMIYQAINLGDKIYFLTLLGDPADKWELMETDTKLKGARKVASGGFDLIGEEVSLSSGNGRVFLSGTGTNGKSLCALIYTPDMPIAESDETQTSKVPLKGMEIFMQPTLTGNEVATVTVCDGEAIIALLSDGRIARITKDDIQFTEIMYSDSLLRCEDGTVSVLNTEAHELYTMDAFPQFDVSHTYDRLEHVRGFALWGNNASIMAADSDGTTNLYLAGADTQSEWKTMPPIEVSFSERILFVDHKPQAIWITVGVIAAGLILSAMLAIYVRRLIIRVSATFAAVGCAMLAVICFLVFQSTDVVASAVLDAVSGEAVQEYIALEDALASVTFSAFLYGLVTLLVAIGIASLFTALSLWPMRDLTRRLNRFTEGDFSVDGIVSIEGDLGKMSRAVMEMGVSLSIKQYETDRMISSYSRFVPRDADRLLERAGIMEVCTGDVAEINEYIAIVSVENRNAVMHSMDSHGFMAFVNSCFTSILEFANKRRGALLSSEFLTTLPILFSKHLGAKDGDSIRFGLDLIDRMSGAGSDLPTPDFFILLHKTDFLYGIAGTDDKAFPFISSAELNFLSGCNAPLRKLGIRMAATEQYFHRPTDNESENLESSCTKRHIGLISFADESRDYKMYEILDCLSDKERNLRISYDERLQNAIEMFYRNDFYPAMVEFSAILKFNPGDGLVRWYAFACEKYFNEGDRAVVKHQLLGVERI
jgi:hypothetical protein